MNKYKTLRKATMRTGIIAAIVFAVAVAIYIGISMQTSSVAQEKISAESQFRTDKDELDALKNKINQSTEAEKRYLGVKEDRVSDAYETNLKVLKDYLGQANTNYKFVESKLTPVEAISSVRPELMHFTYDVKVWKGFSITFKAISDVHVFSFLEEFRKVLPGFIRIDALEVKRLADFGDASLAAIKDSGAMPLNIEAKIQFTWVGLSLKDVKDMPANTGSGQFQGNPAIIKSPEATGN